MPYRSRICRAWMAAALVIIAACGDSPTKPTDRPVAASLVFDAQPSNAVAGAAISPAIRVRVLDASGNAFTGAATVTIALGNVNGATLLGTSSAAAANGVATFSDLRLEKAGVGYVLNASSGSLTATSNAFDVTHAAATKLRFVDQPHETAAGTPMTPPVTVEITDAYNNRATSAVDGITLTRAGGPSAMVLGSATVVPVAGLATFSDISMSRPGTYSLSATATGLTAATSESFTVRATEAARFCPSPVASGSSFHLFADAIASVTDGGTVVICDGTHDLNAAGVNRPVTIRPENPGMVVITNTTSPFPFFVGGFAAGTARISGFTFEVSGAAGVYVNGTYDKLIVEGSTFRGRPNAEAAVDVNANSGPSADAMVTVRDNTASGFKDAFAARNGARMEVVDNTIDASSNNAVFFGIDSRGLIQRNRITGCGANSCIQAEPLNGGPVDILDNEITTDISRNTSVGILARGRVVVRRNRVLGTGGVGVQQPIAPGNFAIKLSGIAVGGVAGFTPLVEGNEIRNAYYGFQLMGPPTAAGSIVQDNRINRVAYGFYANDVGAADRIERNDVAEYAGAANVGNVAAGGSFKCNYWGRWIGPFQSIFEARPPGDTWQPYTRVPIANNPAVTCDPAGPPLPTRFCPTEAPLGYGWEKFADAYAATLSGGTITVCNGTHVASGVINRPMTIASENPLGATLLAPTGATEIFVVSHATAGGKNIFRDLVFLNTEVASTIHLASYGEVTIENNRFTMTRVGASGVTIGSDGMLEKVTIRGNAFNGGTQGVFAQGSGNVDIIDNSFEAQLAGASNASVDLREATSTFMVVANVFRMCPNSCIKTIGVDLQILDNTIEGRVADATRTAITTFNGFVIVSRNTIESNEPIAAADRSTANAYAFPNAAIVIGGDNANHGARVDSNVVRHAYVGILASNGASVAGVDNVVTLTNTGINVLTVEQTFNRNDFVDFITGASGVTQPAGSLSCNYWGSAAAPTVGVELQTAVQPHSQVPIARKPTVVCP